MPYLEPCTRCGKMIDPFYLTCPNPSGPVQDFEWLCEECYAAAQVAGEQPANPPRTPKAQSADPNTQPPQSPWQGDGKAIER